MPCLVLSPDHARERINFVAGAPGPDRTTLVRSRPLTLDVASETPHASVRSAGRRLSIQELTRCHEVVGPSLSRMRSRIVRLPRTSSCSLAAPLRSRRPLRRSSRRVGDFAITIRCNFMCEMVWSSSVGSKAGETPRIRSFDPFASVWVATSARGVNVHWFTVRVQELSERIAS